MRNCVVILARALTSPAADIYALGVMLHELATGVHPEEFGDLARKHADQIVRLA